MIGWNEICTFNALLRGIDLQWYMSFHKNNRITSVPSEFPWITHFFWSTINIMTWGFLGPLCSCTKYKLQRCVLSKLFKQISETVALFSPL